MIGPESELLTNIDNLSEIKQYSNGIPREPSTGSVTSLNTALYWFRNCTQNHQRCSSQALQPNVWYPTRLIDLGDDDGSNVVRLVLTQETNLPFGAKYTTLSHVWGNLDFIKLTKNSLPAFREALSLNQLPKTFTDAIKVTRFLKIRYLWIDSLCIIQEGDALEDWSREASLMGKVYNNSACNISALAATDGTKGLFFERDSINLSPSAIKVPRKFVRTRWTPLGKTRFKIFEHTWVKDVEQAVLNRRAVSSSQHVPFFIFCNF